MARISVSKTVTNSSSAAAICIAAALGVLASSGAAHAAIFYTGGVGATVYGVAPYGGGPQVAPAFIANNITGFNDIMSTPGHGFQLASPVIANNIFETGIQPLALGSFQIGGGNGNGPFGSASTLITGPRIGFGIRDVFAGGGSASYSISSWDANFLVGAGGFAGNLGTFLSIGGQVTQPNSAVAVSLVSNYFLNGAYIGGTVPLILAAAGNGNFQALGGSGAALVFGGGGSFRGLAIDNVFANLLAGTQLRVVSTLTAYADPASIESIPLELNLDLLPQAGGVLPDFAFASGAGGIPEPSVWTMLIAGFAAVGAFLRRRRPVVA